MIELTAVAMVSVYLLALVGAAIGSSKVAIQLSRRYAPRS